MYRSLLLSLALSIAHLSKGSELPITVTHPNLEQVYAAPSLAAVLSNPERYLGKSVSLFGFYSGQSSLFLTRDHATYQDYTSSIHIENVEDDGLSIRESCGDHYVEIRVTLELAPGVSAGLGQFYLLANLRRATLFRDASCSMPCWPLESLRQWQLRELPRDKTEACDSH
ncbi:MAG: hypothetical protein AAGF57_11885 [Pseudomonadota bacterium]